MLEKAAKIRLLLLDVDGVMTDGRIVYDDQGVESKAFDVKDGHGIKLLQRAGIEVGIITGRQSRVVAKRAQELGIELVYQNAKDKLQPYREILERCQLKDEEVAYLGDDLVDLPILKRVGLACMVADGVEEIRPFVHYETKAMGGRGAVREVCDLLLKSNGAWEKVTRRYFA